MFRYRFRLKRKRTADILSGEQRKLFHISVFMVSDNGAVTHAAFVRSL